MLRLLHNNRMHIYALFTLILASKALLTTLLISKMCKIYLDIYIYFDNDRKSLTKNYFYAYTTSTFIWYCFCDHI